MPKDKTAELNLIDPQAMGQTTKERAHNLLEAVVQAHGRGEKRAEQEVMVNAVAEALDNDENLLIQAGTGTGKGIGYLVPLIASGKRAVVSTATKQLSEQLANEDAPFLERVALENGMGEVTYSVLKGRASYLCLRKLDDLERLDRDNPSSPQQSDIGSLFAELGVGSPVVSADAKTQKRVLEIQAIDAWGKRTDHDGDRSNGPVVSDETWRTVSSTPAECPGRSACPFGNQCFAEIARDRAANSQIVMTNHALVGTDLIDETSPWRTLGARDVVVFDEVHELDNYLSKTWGTALNHKGLEAVLKDLNRVIPPDDATNKKRLHEAGDASDLLRDALSDADDMLVEGSWVEPFESILDILYVNLAQIAPRVDAIAMDDKSVRSTTASKSLQELLESLHMLMAKNDDYVRWIGDEDGKKSLCAAPLRVGPKLMSALQAAETTMVATSATISVGGSFEIPARNLALDESPYPYKALDVGTPFDYPRQGILYIPSPQNFPAPTGQERFEHTEAVLDELVEFVKAAGGRTLALSTTSAGARRMAEHLRDHVDTPVYSQFDAPPAVIAKQFQDEEHATLCATMGMWHGLNIPGSTLSAVVIDKIPFQPMNEPLPKARIKDVDARGGNGFMDIYVASATVMLAQGVGRLIRHTQDRGVVAILDVRLRTARYGRTVLNSLPPMWLTSDKARTLEALKRLADIADADLDANGADEDESDTSTDQ